MAKFQFKMADCRHIIKYWKCYNLPIIGPIWTKLGWSYPIMSSTCLPWCGCHGNSALNIQQLWASGGWTLKPILMKFGTQQQISTSITVTW